MADSLIGGVFDLFAGYLLGVLTGVVLAVYVVWHTLEYDVVGLQSAVEWIVYEQPGVILVFIVVLVVAHALFLVKLAR